MKRKMMVGLLVLMIAFIFNTTTFAQATPDDSTSPSASSGTNNGQGNKGGQLRGLDRADQVAGQHGQQGRETARDAQLKRQARPERSGVMERPVKPERPGR